MRILRIQKESIGPLLFLICRHDLFVLNTDYEFVCFTDDTSTAQLSYSWNYYLKVQSRKLYSNKDMIASTQITNTEIFSSLVVLVFKLLNRKILFINRKDNRNC